MVSIAFVSKTVPPAQVRLAFFKEHGKIQNFAQKSSWSWSSSSESDVWKAWFRALKVLRSLINRSTPSDVVNTLLLLGLAKSVASQMDGPPREENLEAFVRDLPRWQVLFNEQDGSLQAYQEAVKAIWHVDVTGFEAKPLNKHTAIEQFQNMAFSLVTGMESMLKNRATNDFGSSRTSSPGPSQPTARGGCTEPFNSQTNQIHLGHDSGGSGQPKGLYDGESMQNQKTSKRKGLLELLEDGRSFTACHSRSDIVLLLLMMGAIFAILLRFLLDMRDKMREAIGDTTQSEKKMDVVTQNAEPPNVNASVDCMDPSGSANPPAFQLLLDFFEFESTRCCNKTYSNTQNFNRHRNEAHNDKPRNRLKKPYTGRKRKHSE